MNVFLTKKNERKCPLTPVILPFLNKTSAYRSFSSNHLTATPENKSMQTELVNERVLKVPSVTLIGSEHFPGEFSKNNQQKNAKKSYVITKKLKKAKKTQKILHKDQEKIHYCRIPEKLSYY